MPVDPDTIPDYFNDALAAYLGDRVAPVYDDPKWEYARILGEREKVIMAVSAEREKRRKAREAIGVQFTPTIPVSTMSGINYSGVAASPLSRYGLASWYGPGFHGRKMANGKVFNMYDPTLAASLIYPLGTQLIVTDTRTGRYIIVTVTDRGPYVGGRIIDLSMAAAQALASDYAMVGVFPVRVTPLLATTATSKLLRPVPGRISRWPVGQGPSRIQHGYNAVDFDGNTGDPVLAANSGRVVSSGWDDGYGNTIVIDHGNGLQTMYGHLNQRFVKTGDFVYQGQSIGTVGNTGQSRGSHLHFEVRISGTKVNPLEF
ncbi:MAG TPA: septal ring lytic transglycosylase RlpA family protein [bacterium]|nr:septal ring lytic transglycosylase RlpA family protein [bacterium]